MNVWGRRTAAWGWKLPPWLFDNKGKVPAEATEGARETPEPPTCVCGWICGSGMTGAWDDIWGRQMACMGIWGAAWVVIGTYMFGAWEDCGPIVTGTYAVFWGEGAESGGVALCGGVTEGWNWGWTMGGEVVVVGGPLLKMGWEAGFWSGLIIISNFGKPEINDTHKNIHYLHYSKLCKIITIQLNTVFCPKHQH